LKKKIELWKGELSTLGGRITLIIFVLATVVLYWLSILKLPIKVKKNMDRILRKFLWFDGSTV
jgi:hypothetical protein